ncbi:MAG: contractile injection system protein, VgrG/Pvc8 family [Asticcacaulis sp.]
MSNPMPVAAWRAVLNGEDITSRFNPRLLSVSVRQSRAEEADQIDIILDDSDGAVGLPPEGAVLRVFMGWAQGAGVPLGLIDMGSFKMDELSMSGPPDQITLTGRSAAFTDGLRQKRERSFVGERLSAVLERIAADNDLRAHISADYADIIIPALGGTARSDVAMLKALGKRFDAVATIKSGTLIFTPVNAGKNASGATLAPEVIDRSMTSAPFRFERVGRNTYSGVSAVWHNQATGRRETVTVGGGGDGDKKSKRLRRVYSSEADASAAARAEFSRIGRASGKMSFGLPLGRADIGPERPVTLTGFKAPINEARWLVAEATHSMDGSGGLKSDLRFEGA